MSAQQHLRKARDRRARAEASRKAADAETRAAIKMALSEAPPMTFQAIGDILGISRQRVEQMAKED